MTGLKRRLEKLEGSGGAGMCGLCAKRDWHRGIVGQLGFEMRAQNFKWMRDGGWQTYFLYRDGVRVR